MLLELNLELSFELLINLFFTRKLLCNIRDFGNVPILLFEF